MPSKPQQQFSDFAATARGTRPHAKLHPLPLAAVHWTAGFWADRFQTCKDCTVPSMGRIMQESERPRFVGNFEVAVGLVEGKHRGAKWDDGDFYKWLESAAAILAQSRLSPAPGTPGEGRGGGSSHDEASTLDANLDHLISLIARAQDPDGYIHTDIQIRQHAGEDAKRFGNPMDFEMYNIGHLMTAACIHHEATGKTNLLAIAQKAADFLAIQFKSPTPEVARHGICPAHLMGLVDLYRTTSNRKYLDLAVKLLAMRDLVEKGDDDNQDRLPLKQHREIVGHAVRATYLYAGIADIFAETGDESLLPVLHSTWNDLVSHKLHITGGCGALFDGASPDGSEKQDTITRVHQAFGRNYQLPQSTAHNETCAAIGSVFWNWRMLQLTADPKFADLLEQTLYNSVLTGISLDGSSYFYTNTLRQLNPMPVDLRWDRRREKTIACFCCPPNVARTLAESANYAYLQSDRDLYVVLYGSSTLETNLNDQKLKLRQETNYPWDGQINLTIDSAPADPFTIYLRIPAWAKNITLKINGKPVAESLKPLTFHPLTRKWSPNDTIELNLPMPVRFIESNPYVEETRNHLAILRGPIVYCLESTDLPADVRVLDVGISQATNLTPATDSRLPGITVLKGQASAVTTDKWSTELYRDLKPHPTKTIDLQLIPYFAWDNRGESEMTVWLPRTGEGK